MKGVLLDTHALLWWLDGDERLSLVAREAIGGFDREIYVSAASAWEITTKFRLGKLPGAAKVANDVAGCVKSQGFRALPIQIEHAQRSGHLPGHHRDPFDRMLVAQALVENLQLVTNELLFERYGVERLW